MSNWKGEKRMDKVDETKEFDIKFNELNLDNQRYIIAIQQALIFAQSTEKAAIAGTDC